MKKHLILIITMLISCLYIHNPIQAVETNQEDTVLKTNVVNEYNLLLDEINNLQYKMKLYTVDSDYDKLSTLLNQKKQCIEFLYQQKCLPIEKLKQQNYTNSQIEALRNFDGSDKLAAAASAYVYTSGATISETSTKHGVRFSWHWMGTPALTGPAFTDGVAIRWQSVNASSIIIHTVKHADTNAFVRYGNSSKPLSITYYSASRAVEAKFNMSGADGSELSWASSGVFDIYITLPSGTSTTINHTSFEFVYAHSYLTTSFNVSFSYPGSFGISVTTGEELCVKNWEVYIK